jgi:hypothetical protein
MVPPLKGILSIVVSVFFIFAWLFSGQPMNVTVQVKYTDGTPVEGAAIVATDYLTGKTYTATTDANGIAQLSIPNFDSKWFGMTLAKDGANFPSEYDANHDGVIDMDDILYFALKYGSDTSAIGSIRVIVPPKYDESKVVTTSTYPNQTIMFSDVPAPPPSTTAAPTPSPTVPTWLTSIFTPPTLYLTIAVIALVAGGLLIAVKTKPKK